MLPARADRTVNTIRWGQIVRELRQRGLLDEPGTFLFTDYWQFSAALEMATERAAPVACFFRDARSFTYWSKPQDWVGRDGIFVRVEDGLADADFFAPWFTRIEPLSAFPIVRAGFPMQTVRLYRCVQQTEPFLFGFAGPGRVPRPSARTKPGQPVEGPMLGFQRDVPVQDHALTSPCRSEEARPGGRFVAAVSRSGRQGPVLRAGERRHWAPGTARGPTTESIQAASVEQPGRVG